ncbi:uncharacterized protein G2W53_015857 [Senna tora]|uniref:Uncharacterized protein n=1 Tax=Senna tora TaxID=362788 RepID=A0A834WWB8_9FABA|nr:uncharacterized protein G2W53_015857 [Senna tora]
MEGLDQDDDDTEATEEKDQHEFYASNQRYTKVMGKSMDEEIIAAHNPYSFDVPVKTQGNPYSKTKVYLSIGNLETLPMEGLDQDDDDTEATEEKDKHELYTSNQ